MVTGIAKNIAELFVRENVIEKEKQDLLRYGIELIASTVIGTVIVIGLGIVLSALDFSLIFLLVFVPMRKYTGGYHADTYFRCNLTLAIAYILTYVVSKIIPHSLYTYVAIGVIAFVYVIEKCLCPVDNPHKRLNTEQKHKYKKYAYIYTAACSFGCLLLLNVRDYSMMISMTMMSVAILIVVGYFKNRRKV